jgi:hypothetical protein
VAPHDGAQELERLLAHHARQALRVGDHHGARVVVAEHLEDVERRAHREAVLAAVGEAHVDLHGVEVDLLDRADAPALGVVHRAPVLERDQRLERAPGRAHVRRALDEARDLAERRPPGLGAVGRGGGLEQEPRQLARRRAGEHGRAEQLSGLGRAAALLQHVGVVLQVGHQPLELAALGRMGQGVEDLHGRGVAEHQRGPVVLELGPVALLDMGEQRHRGGT